MRATALPLFITLVALPTLFSADSHAYIMASGFNSRGSLYPIPGSIVPFNAAKGAFGTPYFVPIGGSFLVVAPSTKQLWEVS
jgi:hypothetical protein